MAENAVYCTNCGSMVKAGDSFCGVCGNAVSPNARRAAPTHEVPTQAYAPSGAADRERRGRLALFAGLGVVALVVVVVGVILAANLFLGETETQVTQTPPPENTTEATDGESAQDEEPPENSSNENSSNEESSEPEGDEPLGIGDSIEVGGVSVTLNEVRSLPKSGLDQPVGGDDDSFLAADVTFENSSEDSVAVSSLLEFTLKDGDGYSASQTVHSQQREFAEGDVAPGQRTSGEIVYEVPPGASDLQLDYAPFAAGETHIWEIGDPQNISGPARSATGVEPSSVTASATSESAPDASGEMISYDANLTSDGSLNTAWNVDGDGAGQSVTLRYDEPVRVDRIGLIPGYDKVDPSDGTYRFYQLYVIKRAEFSFSDGSTVEADFAREPLMQYTAVPETETDEVTVTILETYPPGPSPYGETYPYDLQKAAISEIEVEGP